MVKQNCSLTLVIIIIVHPSSYPTPTIVSWGGWGQLWAEAVGLSNVDVGQAAAMDEANGGDPLPCQDGPEVWYQLDHNGQVRAIGWWQRDERRCWSQQSTINHHTCRLAAAALYGRSLVLTYLFYLPFRLLSCVLTLWHAVSRYVALAISLESFLGSFLESFLMFRCIYMHRNSYTWHSVIIFDNLTALTATWHDINRTYWLWHLLSLLKENLQSR